MKKDMMALGRMWIIACIGTVILLAGCATTEQSLVSAVFSGDVMTAKQLIARGADVNAAAGGSLAGLPTSSPLLIAVHKGNVEMVRLLVENGADVNQGALVGTPLGLASSEGRKDIVEMLLKSNTADVNAKDPEGKTPLHEAAKAGHTDVVKILVQRGADVNVQVTGMKVQRTITDGMGRRTEIVDAGASYQSSTAEPKGITPLGLALKYGRTATAEYLRSVGAKE